MADPTFKHSDIDSAIVHWLNDYAPQGILITDTSFAIRGWNRWLEQNTCYTAEAVSGKCLFDVFLEVAERRLDQSYQEALSGKVTLLAHRFHRYLLKLAARPEYGLAEMQQSALIAPLVRDGQIVGTSRRSRTSARESQERTNSSPSVKPQTMQMKRKIDFCRCFRTIFAHH